MKKSSLKTLAYDTIKEKIVTGEYAPCEFLNEELLSARLQISRTPIRDALVRLEQEGLVEIRPKKGSIVTPLSVKDINMIFEIRRLYEPYILKTYGELIPEEQFHRFFKTFSQESTSSKCQSHNQYFYELDAAFHQIIVDACPNPYLRQSYARTQTQSDRFRFMTGNVSNSRVEDTLQEHLDILTSCLQKDWEAAAQKLLSHLEASKKATFSLVLASMDSGNITF